MQIDLNDTEVFTARSYRTPYLGNVSTHLCIELLNYCVKSMTPLKIPFLNQQILFSWIEKYSHLMIHNDQFATDPHPILKKF